MLTGKAAKTLIILVIVLFAFSAAEGDDFYCVSLKKKFKISSKIHYSIMAFGFTVTNAEMYSLLHNPPGWLFDFRKDDNGNGGFSGGVPVFAGGIRLNFFYDDFVVIKKKKGVKLNEVKLELSLQTIEVPKDDTDDKDSDGDKSYDFTNKNFNIRRCKDRLF